MSGDYEIPFDDKGNQLHYPGWPASSIVWADNHTFSDKLRFQGYRRGRSAAYFEFERANGASVTMFLKDFDAAVPYMVRGQLDGEFRFVKRGQNYGAQFQVPA